MHDALEFVLAALRPGFDADGFDVTVDSARVELKHEHLA